MIISRTPFRISLFGGGTDFPAWYMRHGGAVLAGAINKYCYLYVRYLPPFLGLKHRVVWSKIENCITDEQVDHPAVRALIKHLGIERGLEVHHMGDLPARSGMGSSSAFTVGLLNALHALGGRMISKHDLSIEAIHIEQNILKENVGSQDQISASYGGLNYIEFFPTGDFSVTPVTVSKQRVTALEDHLMLFYTGIMRTSSDLQSDFLAEMDKKKRQLRIMTSFVDEAVEIIGGDRPLAELGELLKEAWDTKRTFSKSVSNHDVDRMHDMAIEAGATGGKLTGAGGGGFMLLFVPPDKRDSVSEALSSYIEVPFRFEYSGSRIIFADHDVDNYTSSEISQVFQPVSDFRELGSRNKS